MNNLLISPLLESEVDVIKKIEEEQNIDIISKKNILMDLKRNSVIYYTLKLDNNIVGYVAFSYILEEMDIHSIVISNYQKKKGYASLLLNYVFNFAKDNNIRKIFLEVRKSNTSAINLYKKFGFTYITTRKNYYPDNFEDALIYVRELV